MFDSFILALITLFLKDENLKAVDLLIAIDIEPMH